VSDAIRAGRDGGDADARWRAAETLARHIAATLDATTTADPYAVAQLAPRLLAVLQELRLTPAAAGSGADSLGDFLNELTAAPVLDPA